MDSRLVILDVDGVMTNGTKLYGPDGRVVAKSFCDLDFTAIKKFKDNGWVVCWLSADKTVNEAVAKDRNIDFWYSRNDDGSIDKVKWIIKLSQHYGISLDNVVYAGDDLFDIPAMQFVLANGGFSACPKNAVVGAKNIVSNVVIDVKGGYGFVMGLYNLFFMDFTPPCN